MLVSLFSFVPQTEPEVFTGQWGEHRAYLVPNNYNHAVVTFDIPTDWDWDHTVAMKVNWKDKNSKFQDGGEVFKEINN